MAPCPVLRQPDPVLRSPAAPVTDFGPSLRDIAGDRPATMSAAPQPGMPRARAVADAREGRGQAVRMADPAILQARIGARAHAEASPNLPGIPAGIGRARARTPRFRDAAGTGAVHDCVRLCAGSVRHRIDHRAGRMGFGRRGPVRRDILLRRARRSA
jgi:peptide deformylase